MKFEPCKHRWVEMPQRQADLASSRIYKCLRCAEMRFVP